MQDGEDKPGISTRRAPPAFRAVQVGDTACGRGVFTRIALRSGQLVAEIRGVVIDDPSYESDYCMDLDDGTTLEPTAPFCYLNHSCDANCAWFVSWGPADGRRAAVPSVWLEALDDIEAGSELTIDYGWPDIAPIACRCASPHCRGWVVAGTPQRN